MISHVCILIFMIGSVNILAGADEPESLMDDLLLPYDLNEGSVHGSSRHIREIEQIQSSKYNYTYEIVNANKTENLTDISTTRYFVSDVVKDGWNSYEKVTAYGHMTTVNNPLRTFSVLEPGYGDGCARKERVTVMNTAQQRNCIVAQNGGFFNTATGNCLGNIVSDGRVVRNIEVKQNANFGITQNDSIVTGYLSPEDISNLHFKQLIQGVIWLVRNGSSYVDDAIKCESSDMEETGTLKTFVEVHSARTAIGHDAFGRVVLVQVEGQTRVRGVSLYEFAKLLIKEFHLVNAINLDGGGSATFVLNGSLSNYPSDHCKEDPEWRCARRVSTIVCVHEADCEENCQFGFCRNGNCSCDENYRGSSCNILFCGNQNCSNHGICMPDGCDCHPGWNGTECTAPCTRGTYGKNCSQICRCMNNGSCDPVTGTCDCVHGYGGSLCGTACPLGQYGKNCQFNCHCADTCSCDPVSGMCVDIIGNHSTDLKVAQCLARDMRIREEQENDKESFQIVHLMAIFCTIAGVAVLSLAFNVYLLLLRSDCVRHYYEEDEDDVKEYVPLRDISRKTRGKLVKGEGSKFRKIHRSKHKLPAWDKLIDKVRDKGRRKDGYTRLLLPENNRSLEETALLNQVR